MKTFIFVFFLSLVQFSPLLSMDHKHTIESLKLATKNHYNGPIKFSDKEYITAAQLLNNKIDYPYLAKHFPSEFVRNCGIITMCSVFEKNKDDPHIIEKHIKYISEKTGDSEDLVRKTFGFNQPQTHTKPATANTNVPPKNTVRMPEDAAPTNKKYTEEELRDAVRKHHSHWRDISDSEFKITLKYLNDEIKLQDLGKFFTTQKSRLNFSGIITCLSFEENQNIPNFKRTFISEMAQMSNTTEDVVRRKFGVNSPATPAKSEPASRVDKNSKRVPPQNFEAEKPQPTPVPQAPKSKPTGKSSKTELCEFLRDRSIKSVLKYTEKSRSVVGAYTEVSVEVMLPGHGHAIGTGKNKNDAEQAAARNLLMSLRESMPEHAGSKTKDPKPTSPCNPKSTTSATHNEPNNGKPATHIDEEAITMPLGKTESSHSISTPQTMVNADTNESESSVKISHDDVEARLRREALSISADLKNIGYCLPDILSFDDIKKIINEKPYLLLDAHKQGETGLEPVYMMLDSDTLDTLKSIISEKDHNLINHAFLSSQSSATFSEYIRCVYMIFNTEGDVVYNIYFTELDPIKGLDHLGIYRTNKSRVDVWLMYLELDLASDPELMRLITCLSLDFVQKQILYWKIINHYNALMERPSDPTVISNVSTAAILLLRLYDIYYVYQFNAQTVNDGLQLFELHEDQRIVQLAQSFSLTAAEKEELACALHRQFEITHNATVDSRKYIVERAYITLCELYSIKPAIYIYGQDPANIDAALLGLKLIDNQEVLRLIKKLYRDAQEREQLKQYILQQFRATARGLDGEALKNLSAHKTSLIRRFDL